MVIEVGQQPLIEQGPESRRCRERIVQWRGLGQWKAGKVEAHLRQRRLQSSSGRAGSGGWNARDRAGRQI